MADATREFLIARQEERGERPRVALAEDVRESVAFRAQLLWMLYQELTQCGFSPQEAVAITAGQHF